jgi:hypothetical protein
MRLSKIAAGHSEICISLCKMAMRLRKVTEEGI